MVSDRQADDVVLTIGIAFRFMRRVPPMASYRLFFIGRDNHIVKAEVVDCPTDDDAIAVARTACGKHPAVEVWHLARRVERIDASLAAGDGVS
jgi:hypothetical protein